MTVFMPGDIPLQFNEHPPTRTVEEFWAAYGDPLQWPICEREDCEVPGIVPKFIGDECGIFCFWCAGRPPDPTYVEAAGGGADEEGSST